VSWIANLQWQDENVVFKDVLGIFLSILLMEINKLWMYIGLTFQVWAEKECVCIPATCFRYNGGEDLQPAG
jgi:hypothetical protein